MPSSTGPGDLKIGMIDTDVDVDHAVFSASRITRRSFLSVGHQRNLSHGTGVASLLVGNADGFRGIAPENHLFAASVFAEYPDRGLVATSHDLVAAMDWLTEQSVNAVNISLSGPTNRVVATAIEAMAEQQVVLVAAVGNQGPFAPPRYPAAYDQVVGVTAIDQEGRIYSRAGRGDHVDYAGPGVAVKVARAESGDGLDSATGTSYAAPLITGLMLAYQNQQGHKTEGIGALRKLIRKDVIDLGEPGRDTSFGEGMPGREWIAKGLELER